MSLIKIEDIGYVRLRAPDLDEMSRFLADFGLQVLHPQNSFKRRSPPT